MNTNKKIATEIESRIVVYSDFPKPGIKFKDIFPLFQHPSLCDKVVQLFYETLQEKHNSKKINAVLGLDSRGFLFAPPLAAKLGATFIPIRKKGKLPGKVISSTFSLEYGEDTIEVQEGPLTQGQNVVIVDDILATGGTMAAACELVKQLNVNLVECLVVIELTGLNGRRLLGNNSLYSIVQNEF